MNDNPYESPEQLEKGASSSARNRKVAVGLGCLLLVLAVLAFLVLPVVSRGVGFRQAVRRTACQNNLRQIALAIFDYEARHGSLPPAYTVDGNGKPLHSWRALLLPYLKQQALFDQIDFTKSWDDPANAEARKAMAPVFVCPSRRKLTAGHTTYMVVVAPDSCFPGSEPRTLKEITDGPSNTLLVVEVCASQSVHWMSPEDAPEPMVFRIPAGAVGERPSPAPHGGGLFNMAYADGSTRSLFADDLSDASRRVLISVNGKDRVESDE